MDQTGLETSVASTFAAALADVTAGRLVRAAAVWAAGWGDGWARERQDDRPEDARRRRTVHARSLLEVDGDGVEVALQ